MNLCKKNCKKSQSGQKPPPSATKFYPEFQGRQLNLKDMLATSSQKATVPVNTTTNATKRPLQSSTLAPPAAKKSKQEFKN